MHAACVTRYTSFILCYLFIFFFLGGGGGGGGGGVPTIFPCIKCSFMFIKI